MHDTLSSLFKVLEHITLEANVRATHTKRNRDTDFRISRY